MKKLILNDILYIKTNQTSIYNIYNNVKRINYTMNLVFIFLISQIHLYIS